MTAIGRPVGSVPRRRLLAAAGATALALALPAGAARALGRHGRIEPREPLPEIALLRDDGTRTTLARQLRGRSTALHFMFTGCTSTCPIQGATFARLQERLAPHAGERLQLLSISVDPLGDDARALARWRERLGAGPRWRAAVPLAADAGRLVDWAGGGRPYGADTHAQQVLLVDDRARLAFRSLDLPEADEVARLLVQLDALRG
jgi:protein SCO1/2